jgi:UDP-2,3-diacylglucosamine hydrolase
LIPGKKIYFASDFHLGVPAYEKSLQREKLVCKWLDEVKQDAEEIYLVGDVFDFWFEHKFTVPKGFVRLMGKIAEITDSGIKVHMFTGNHDMWIKGYLPQELNVSVFYEPIEKTYNGKQFFIGHGDGLGPGDHKYKFIKKVFSSKVCQWLFARLHPNLSFGVANYFSKKSRSATGSSDEKFLGNDNEWLYIFCRDHLKNHKVDYFIFGHRHLPLDLDVEGKARYINLGDWLRYNSYAVFDGERMELKYYK